MTPPESWAGAGAWRQFFDALADAVLVLDAEGRIVLANTAFLRLVPCDVGAPLRELQPLLGATLVRSLAKAAAQPAEPALPAAMVRLADGRAAWLAAHRLDARHLALRLQPDAGAPPMALPPLPDSRAGASVREVLRLFWDSPFPATVQGDDFRLTDVNRAFVDFSGYRREQLIGRDPLELVPEEDRLSGEAARRALQASFGRTDEPALAEGRLVDASGRKRSFRLVRRVLVDHDGKTVYLALMQDTTAERIARERAERSVRELDDWFELSPVGMVLYDSGGLLVRTNPAFDSLVGRVPVMLKEAPESLRQLLGWEGAAPLAGLAPGAPALTLSGWVAPPEAEPRRLCAIVRCFVTAGGQRRYMAVVEDRSVEDERDLAQMQIGALMDTAGVGLATFQESSGWVRRPAGRGAGAPALSAATARGASALQSISREIVVAESLPEYERLQKALRHAERAEVRYAIQHAELGLRWLLTRVEPATLASGKRTTSVVTLDITEQHTSQQRGEQLLREMTTILESTAAGIAYLRGDVLVRCNRRFETMLGLEAGAVAGTPVERLFASHPEAGQSVAEGLRSLGADTLHEAELEFAGPGGGERRWYALSLRRAVAGADPTESIAVLSDVTRMKTQQIELEILARDRELMFSLSEVGIAFVREQRVQRANAALAELSGWSVDELSMLELAALFVDAADFKRRWAQEERDLRLHGRWSGERQLRRRDGGLVWVQVSKRLVDRTRPAGGMIASYVDVDARHRAERAVSLQAERTRSILDSVLVGIVNVGPHGIEWMNRSAQRMFGGRLEDFIGEPLATVATPEPDHPFRRTRYLDELVAGQAETFECRVRARDGREFGVVGNAVATERESTGRQLTYALLDIERRRQAEARMSEAQSALQQVIAAAPLAIALIDARTFKVVQANEVAATAVDRSLEQLVGGTLDSVFEPAIAEAWRLDIANAANTGGVTTREYRFDRVGRAASRIWDARFVAIDAGPGQAPDQVLLVATDVSEQRAAAEARLEAAIAQRDMLVKEVHHRIKNNLQGVAGLLQQIAERKPEVASAIGEVVGQVHAIAQVYGLQVGEQGPLRVSDVVRAITASVQRTFGCAIHCEFSGPMQDRWALPEAEAIPIALTLNELLTNAVKHGAADGDDEAIGCRVECEDDCVAVVIANRAVLPAAFSLARIPGSVSGLGLVRALLPRRHATLAIEQRGSQVIATVLLRPPVVARIAAAVDSPTIAMDSPSGSVLEGTS